METTPHAGDVAGSIAQLRELVEHRQNPFSSGRLHDFNAPDGQEIRWALNISTLPATSFLYVLALLFGATAAYAIFVLAGYVASGTAMFLFSCHLTGSAWIGLIAGWAFAFYPFAVVTGEHPNFIHGWVFVLMLWRFLSALEEPSVRKGFWAGAATVLAMSWTQHFIVIGGIFFAGLLLGLLIVGARRRRFAQYAWVALPAAGVVCAFVLTLRLIASASGVESTLPQNSLTDVINTSAKLPMYVVPPSHHLLGGLTTDYLNAHGLNAVEWTLYVGITVLVLAALAILAALLGRLTRNRGAAVFMIGCATLVAFVFSFPPRTTIGGRAIHLPSDLIFATSSSWRLYTRFVIVVMLGLCTLASLGLAWLTSGRSRSVRVAILAGATVLVPLDLWDRPPDHIYRFQVDPVYHVVRAAPYGSVAEYPLRQNRLIGDYLDLYNQDAHGKPILNGYFAGPDERRALSLRRLDDPATAGSLATLGVRYVLLTPWRIDADTPDPGRPRKGFRLLARDAYGSVYRVTAPAQAAVYERDGFWGPEGEGPKQFQWAGAPPVRLGIIAPCNECSGSLELTVASFARPRLVSVRTRDGREIDSFVVGEARRRLRVPLHFDRETIVELVTKPGAQSISETTGSGDFRSVSISVQDLQFVQTRPVRGKRSR